MKNKFCKSCGILLEDRGLDGVQLYCDRCSFMGPRKVYDTPKLGRVTVLPGEGASKVKGGCCGD